MSNNKELEDYLDSIPGMPRAPRQQDVPNASPQGGREIDVNSMLQNRIAQRMIQQQDNGFNPLHQPGFQGATPGPQRDVVFLREGITYYKSVPAEMSPVPIAMLAGPIAGSVGKEFINKGARKYYVVEGNQRVDLGNPDYSKMQVLYAVEAPWVGTILVPESALIKSRNDGAKLLKG